MCSHTFWEIALSAEYLLSFLCGSKHQRKKKSEIVSKKLCPFDMMNMIICLLGEDSGDFTSGLGATGWTGLVCLAASFFRLIRLFSNIS